MIGLGDAGTYDMSSTSPTPGASSMTLTQFGGLGMAIAVGVAAYLFYQIVGGKKSK